METDFFRDLKTERTKDIICPRCGAIMYKQKNKYGYEWLYCMTDYCHTASGMIQPLDDRISIEGWWSLYDLHKNNKD